MKFYFSFFSILFFENFHLERSVANELKSLIEKRRLPFKIDKLTRGNGSCWMISVFQQCKREEINIYLPDDIRSLVNNMDTNGLRIAVCDFMLTSNHPKVKTFKERYERLDGSELPWIELWGAGRKGMRNSTVWADQNFMQATAWLLGVDIKILNSVSISGMINYLSYSGNLEDENVPSIVPPMTIGYRTNSHFQSLLPLEIDDGGAVLIREMNERNLGIQNKNEAIVVTDDENEKGKKQKEVENKKIKPSKIDDINIEYDSEEDKNIKSYKRNIVIINEHQKVFLGKKDKKVRKMKIKNIISDSEIEEIKDISNMKRSISDESLESMRSNKSDGSDLIKINNLFGKPHTNKGKFTKIKH